MDVTEFLQVEVHGNTLMQWIVAAGIATAIILAARLARPVLIRRLKAVSGRTRMVIDDAAVHALEATRMGLISIVALDIGSHALTLPANVQKLVDGAAAIALFMQAGLWASSLLQFWVERSARRGDSDSPRATPSLSAVGFIGRIVLWTVVVLLALDNIGINITTLIAGLGIGGVAVALAVQNILGDLFASLSIVIDKPFVAGDFIIVDGFMGTVEHIGLKTTRVRSVDGEQIIFSNGDLLKGRIKNYKRMYQRRVVFPLRLHYETPPAKLRKVPGIIKRLLDGHDKIRLERSHFHRFGDSSLDVETVFWVLTPDYNVYMDFQQQLNLEVMVEFEKEGIELAFPTRTLKMIETPGNDEAPGDGEGPAATEAVRESKPGRH